MNNTYLFGAVGLIVISFGLGYLAHPTAPLMPPGTRTMGGYVQKGGALGAGMLSGTIAAVSTESLTVNTRDGSSHVVLLTPATTVSKSVSGVLTDVTAGATVLITGTTNSDGSVSASVVQLRPTQNTTPE